MDRIRTFLISEPWRTAAGVLGVALLISLGFNIAGAGGDAEPDDPAAPTTIPVETSTTTTTEPVDQPTTTVDQTDPDPAGEGALVGVKVDNAPGARPQVGIGQAVMLVEIPVEGGLTRFTAIFPRESTGLAGPIRSLRPVDADLLPAVAPIVVSTGGQPFVLREMEAAGMNSVVAGFSSMFVSLGREDPYDTFVDLGLLSSILDDSLLPAGGGLPRGGPLPASDADATEIEMPFEGVRYVYEQGSGYLRQHDGEPFEVLDRSAQDSRQLRHDLLVVMFAAERSAGYTDVNGAPVSTFDVIGSGDLLVLHDGGVLTGSWSRSALADGFELFDGSGRPLGLPDGQTYLAVVPRGSEVTYR